MGATVPQLPPTVGGRPVLLSFGFRVQGLGFGVLGGGFRVFSDGTCEQQARLL